MAYTSTQLKTLATLAKTSGVIKKITSVIINTSKMRTIATNRSIQVVGDTNAVFSLQVSRSSDDEYYNFTTRAFEDNITSQSRLKNQSPGSINIAFPAAASGDTYTIHLYPEPHFNTELSFGKNKLYYSTTITQVGNAEITFATDTSISIISSTAISTSTGSIEDNFTETGTPTVIMDDLQLTVPVAVANYGVFITSPTIASDLNNGTWNSSALYWETDTYVANGAGSGATSLILTSVNGLYVGMQLSNVDGDFQTVLRSITAIDTDTLTVTLDGVETWSDTNTIKFRAYGPNLIKKAVGIGLKLTNGTCKLGQESTTVRTAIASGTATSVDVNGTGGIANGATVRCKFIDKSTSSDECVVDHNTTSGSTTAGVLKIVNGLYCATTTATFNPPASVNVPIRVGTIIYIDGSSADIYLSGTISISKYPSDDENIYVDISKIFTIGVNT